MNIKPEHAAALLGYIKELEATLRQKFDPEYALEEWQLLQRAFVNKDVAFSTYFVITMSGAIYSSPKVIDNIRSPI